MTKPKPNITLLATLASLALLLGSATHAQGFGTAAYGQSMDAWMAQQDAYLDALIAQEYARIEAQQQDAMAALVRYYREQTGDYQTPDALAFEYGVNLYCQHNAAECAQANESSRAASARQHEANMNDIASWGAVSAGIAESNASILDASHQGFLDRSASQDAGHANLIQGAVQGQWTYSNPNSGAGWDLPVVPDPSAAYQTPDGQPLAYDFQTGVWYVGSAWGWTPLEPRR